MDKNRRSLFYSLQWVISHTLHTWMHLHQEVLHTDILLDQVLHPHLGHHPFLSSKDHLLTRQVPQLLLIILCLQVLLMSCLGIRFVFQMLIQWRWTNSSSSVRLGPTVVNLDHIQCSLTFKAEEITQEAMEREQLEEATSAVRISPSSCSCYLILEMFTPFSGMKLTQSTEYVWDIT